MRVDTEVRKLWEDAGYTIRDNTGGHARIYDGDRFVTSLPKSTSTHRAVVLAKYRIRQDQEFKRKLQPQRSGERKAVPALRVPESVPAAYRPLPAVRDKREKLIDPIDLSGVTTDFKHADKSARNRTRHAEEQQRAWETLWGTGNQPYRCYACKRAVPVRTMFFILAAGTPAELKKWGEHFRIAYITYCINDSPGTAARVEWCPACAPGDAMPLAPFYKSDEKSGSMCVIDTTPDTWDDWALLLGQGPWQRRPRIPALGDLVARSLTYGPVSWQ